MEKTFKSVLLRLKEQAGLEEDKQVAELLGLSDKAFNARKSRSSFPEDKLFALVQRRPDLKIDPLYVLSGDRSASDGVRAMYATAAKATALVVNEADREELSGKLGEAIRAQALEGLTARLMDAWGRCDVERKELVCRVAEGLATREDTGHNR